MDLSTDEPAPSDTLTRPVPGAPTTSGHDGVWKILAAVAALALVGFIVYVATRPRHTRAVAFPTATAATLPLDSTAPGFTLPRLGGGPPVSLAAMRGTPVVVNFFASWCPDCKAELAAFAGLAARTSGRVEVIGVDANDGNGTAARRLLTGADATYPVGVDSDAKVATVVPARRTARDVLPRRGRPGRPRQLRDPDAGSPGSVGRHPQHRHRLDGGPVSAESESAPAEVPAEVPAEAPAGTGDPPTRAGLSDAERAAAFSSGRAPVDRTAALRAGSVPVPRKFVLWVIVGFAVLGLGGLIAEHVVGDAGVESAITTPLTTLAGTAPPSIPAAPTGPSVGASPAAVIGLRHLALAPAPALDLTDQHQASWTLGQARGKVVVLTFVNAECNDICPVLADEIAQADRLARARGRLGGLRGGQHRPVGDVPGGHPTGADPDRSGRPPQRDLPDRVPPRPEPCLEGLRCDCGRRQHHPPGHPQRRDGLHRPRGAAGPPGHAVRRRERPGEPTASTPPPCTPSPRGWPPRPHGLAPRQP